MEYISSLMSFWQSVLEIHRLLCMVPSQAVDPATPPVAVTSQPASQAGHIKLAYQPLFGINNIKDERNDYVYHIISLT